MATEHVGALVRRWRNKRNMSQFTLARYLGMKGRGNIQNWESGHDPVPPKHYPTLVKVLGVPPKDLLEATEDLDARAQGEARLLAASLYERPMQVREGSPPYSAPTRLPVYADVQCASFVWAESFELNPEYVDVPPNLWNPERFAIRARGDSMHPEIKDGDLCIFDPPGPKGVAAVKSGTIVVAMLSGDEQGATIKRLIKRRGSVELRPENMVPPNEPIFLIENADEEYGTRFVHEGHRVNLIIRGVLVGLLRDY